LVLTALQLFGCGGGEEQLTKAELIEEGDKICKQAVERRTAGVEAVFSERKKSGKPLRKEDGEELISKVVVPAVDEMVEELDQLSAPEEDQEEFKAIVKSFEETAAKAKADPATAISAAEPFSKPDKMAAAYGFKDCAQL